MLLVVVLCLVQIWLRRGGSGMSWLVSAMRRPELRRQREMVVGPSARGAAPTARATWTALI